MSVQAGIWWFDDKPVTKQELQCIAADISVRCDSQTSSHDCNPGMMYMPFHVTLGSRRERQPHPFDSGNLITWDGRLDNSEELLRDLKLPRDRESTDLAIVTAAFKQWNTGCFRKLVGDWAASIYLAPERKLILARDYAGVRQIFYTLSEKGVKWSTLLAPLALSGRPLRLNDAYFAGFLTMWPDADITPYRDIQLVPPGAFVVITPTLKRTCTFWNFAPRTTIRYRTESEYEDHFRELFRQAIRRRLRTDQPVLAELSGGLDSSSIVCMADDILLKEGAGAPQVDTFSCYDLDEPEEDDIHYFGAIEKKRGRPGHHAELKSSGNTLAFEFPLFSAVPGFGVREELKAIRSELISRSNYRVVLSGIGGDEMLGQTLDPRIILADLLRRMDLRQLTGETIKWSLHSRRPFIELLWEALLLNLPGTMRRLFQKSSAIAPWIIGDFARRYAIDKRRLQAGDGSWFWRASARDVLQTVNTLRRQMSMAPPATFEIRYPYLDQNLVEFLMAIPREQLLRPGNTRSLMRRALSGILPPEIATRSTKSGMGKCIIISISKNWERVERSFHRSLTESLGYANAAPLVEALREIRDGSLSPHFFRALRALSAELWLRDAIQRGVIDADVSTSATKVAGGSTPLKACRIHGKNT
jgi:asparagine synthase (glutamine-hydrolysing)